MADQSIDSPKRTVNHDRSGMWAPDPLNPLDEFASETPSTRPTPPLAAATTLKRRPAMHRVVPHRAAPADPGRTTPAAKDRRKLWSFASGSAFGAIVCVILISWLTSSEQPRAESFTARPEPSPVASAPVPVSPPASDTPPIADRAMRVVVNEPTVSPEVEKRPAASAAQKESFVGSLWIDSTPQGARVFIDRQPAGVTPLLVLDLRAGSHVLRVDADGHMSWSSAIRVIAERQTRVHTTLTPLD